MPYIKISDGCLTYSIEKGRAIPAGFHEVVSETDQAVSKPKSKPTAKPKLTTESKPNTSLPATGESKPKES